jgi:hypothetical protein
MSSWPALLVAAIMFGMGLAALLRTDEIVRGFGDHVVRPFGRRDGDDVRRPLRFFGWVALAIGAVAVAVFFLTG